MLVFVIVVGLILLVALGVSVGVADRAERDAWRRIAAARRELGVRERQLIKAAEARGCAGCEVWRLRAQGLIADWAYWEEDES